MPVSGALFSRQPAPFRVASDGQAYCTLTGEAGSLFAICPEIFTSLDGKTLARESGFLEVAHPIAAELTTFGLPGVKPQIVAVL